MKSLPPSKEVTTCDECGDRLVIPPGVIYRGRKMHKQEANRLARIDFDNEVVAPHLDGIKRDIEDALDVEEE